jgi:hypothetical protein
VCADKVSGGSVRKVVQSLQEFFVIFGGINGREGGGRRRRRMIDEAGETPMLVPGIM